MNKYAVDLIIDESITTTDDLIKKISSWLKDQEKITKSTIRNNQKLITPIRLKRSSSYKKYEYATYIFLEAEISIETLNEIKKLLNLEKSVIRPFYINLSKEKYFKYSSKKEKKLTKEKHN
jgi:ribosomal protein S6